MTRAGLLQRVSSLLATQPSGDGVLGVMLVRLQRLPEIRIAHGYAAGEALAAATAQSIGQTLRPGDEVHVLDDAELAVLLPHLRDGNHALLAGLRVLRILDAPVVFGERAVPVSAAVGLAVGPDQGEDPETLLRRAGIAAGQARRGSERCVLYRAGSDATGVPYELLRAALAGNRLEVHLQPILDLARRRWVGIESLARWRDPEGGLVPPLEFIPLAEDTGLVADLTRWSLNTSLRHAARARRAVADLGVSVNLSPRVFGQRDFVAQVLSSLDVWDLPASALTLEVTETALMEDPATGFALLERLRAEDIGISIDDFGSGYSSLAYLKHLPATELKIDRAFVTDLCRDRRSEQLVHSIIDLGHDLGMEIVAEGVEDADTLERLARLGCDRAQGMHIERPQPAGTLIDLLAREAA
ncbi:putative bifunctional diguanylate cyclase/phosphodiesterase [Novilysobacter arseniciresistens]|uniref:putative bifunctional diguanylate cyclase/phosphodiesterase n=1 Tax=Novilysobacter arseniciresistens TaxID=1385522 RepID=UPI00068E9EDD|nr:GGDEF domain-containing phosphodiesterase [Lysobacter arseniciresistens]